MRSSGLKPAAERDTRERALLERVAQGERPAFEELYCEYHGRLTRFLRRVTRREELIEEIVNDTLWVVWRKAGDFRGGSQVSTWIMGIAYRCALKSLGRNGGADTVSLDDNTVPAAALIGEAADERREELSDWLAHGLRLLPVEQRITLQLAYYLGHSLEEVAEIMDCPTSTVKARMFHARVRLRNLLPALGGFGDRAVSGAHG